MSAIRKCMCLLVLLLSFGWSTVTCATVLPHVDETDLVTEAELIFDGVVTQVQTRLSDRRDPKEHDTTIPFTFVTFKIGHVFKGSAETPDSITLRFIGGVVRMGFLWLKEESLLVPGIPRFSVGDRGVLFVSGNGDRICPLVGWHQGTFRVIEGEIFTDGWREVWLTPEGKLTYGKVHPAKAPSARQLSGQEKELATSSAKQSLPLPTGKRLDLNSFGDFIADSVEERHTREQLRQLRPVRSVSIETITYAPALTPVPPSTPSPKGD